MRNTFLFSSLMLGTLGAATITSTSGPVAAQYAIFSGEAITVSWNLLNAYAGVDIYASLDDGLNNTGISDLGDAYLTTGLGPGTSASDQTAHVTFTFPDAATTVHLFSDLDLNAGETYYLTLFSDTDLGGGWDATSTPAYLADPGVTINAGEYANGGNQNSAYPPGSAFTSGLVYQPLYEVTGTATPEPRYTLCLGLALALIVSSAAKKDAEASSRAATERCVRSRQRSPEWRRAVRYER